MTKAIPSVEQVLEHMTASGSPSGGLWLLRFANRRPVLRCLSPSCSPGGLVGLSVDDEEATEAIPCMANGVPVEQAEEISRLRRDLHEARVEAGGASYSRDQWRGIAHEAQGLNPHCYVVTKIDRRETRWWSVTERAWVSLEEATRMTLTQASSVLFWLGSQELDGGQPFAAYAPNDNERPRRPPRWITQREVDEASKRRLRDLARASSMQVWPQDLEDGRCEHSRDPPRGITLREVAEASARRLRDFGHSDAIGTDWTPLEWAGAQGGEVGELVGAVGALLALVGAGGRAANLTKKIRRGDVTEASARDAVGAELADVLLYGFALARRLGIDLERAVVAKFNEVSERIGSAVRLPEQVDRVVAPECEPSWYPHPDGFGGSDF